MDIGGSAEDQGAGGAGEGDGGAGEGDGAVGEGAGGDVDGDDRAGATAGVEAGLPGALESGAIR